jgi:hypothetical protein
VPRIDGIVEIDRLNFDSSSSAASIAELIDHLRTPSVVQIARRETFILVKSTGVG